MKQGEMELEQAAQAARVEAAQERAEAQRIRRERLRRGSLWLGALVLFGLLLGLMLGRLVNPLPAPWASAPARVLAVQAVSPVKGQVEGWTLRLRLSRPVTYRRTQQPGAVSLTLADLQLAHGARRGRIHQPGLEGSWQLLQRGSEVQLLLVSLSGALNVTDSWQREGGGEQGWLSLTLAPPAAR